MWQRTKQQGKAGFDKAWGWADGLGDPVNKLSQKLGSEAFWPMSIDKESEKAARILSRFCIEGSGKEASSPSPSSSSSPEQRPDDGRPKAKQYVLNKIPPEVIRNALGLAIFTTARTGLLHLSGATGSGILLARLPSGAWSPPSGIQLHAAGLGFVLGVDVCDCVLVINTGDALDAFCKLRCTLGADVSAE